METIYFLGIDISKKKFNAALTIDGKTYHEVQVDNDPKSIQSFFEQLIKMFGFSLSQLIVCAEHTGIYGHPLLDYWVKNEVKVCMEPAVQIKQSQGMTRGKSDQIDAKRIAQYAYKNREELRFWKPQRPSIQKIKALLMTRDRLVKIKTQLEVPINECEEFIDKSIHKDIIKNCTQTLKALKLDIKKIEQTIDKLVKEDEQITQQFKFATSVPGVGKITALNLIIASGEFTTIHDAKKFACYAGVAPFEHSSGSSVRGKTRISKMANMTLKKLLHMAALSAIQCSQELKSFYERKVAQGKNKMSVINAVRNKLISRIFSCIKNKRMYQKDYNHALA